MLDIITVWKTEVETNKILVEEEKLKELEKPECHKCGFHTWYTGEQDCMGLPIIGKTRCGLEPSSLFLMIHETLLTSKPPIRTAFNNAGQCDHFNTMYEPEIIIQKEKIQEMKREHENTHVKSKQVKNEKIILEKKEGEKNNE